MLEHVSVARCLPYQDAAARFDLGPIPVTERVPTRRAGPGALVSPRVTQRERRPGGAGVDVARELLRVEWSANAALVGAGRRSGAAAQLRDDVLRRLDIALFDRLEQADHRPGPLPRVDRPAARSAH